MLFVLTAASCSGSYVAPEITPPDRSNPLPASNEFVTVAETEYLTLQYKQDSCEIRVLDENRTEWNSTPTGSVDDPLAKGQYRMALESIIQATFLSGQGNEDTETAMAGSVRRGDFAAYAIPDGLRVELYFPSKLTTVPVEITLDGNSLLCSVKPEQITVKTPENETEQEAALRGYKIISVALMPYFLSAGADAQGYMFVPDGSGALINLNNGKNGNDYSQKVYGNDPALPALEQRGGVMDALLPVFGIYRDGEGVLCVLEDGAALATVNASVAGRRTSYNTVYATFSLRPLGTYSVTNVDGTIRNIAVATDWPVQTGRVSARYYFLGEGGDYSGMAAAYRSHLEKRGFTRQSYDADANAMLDIYGSVTSVKSVLGVPTQILTPLTGYAQAESILAELNALGVSKPVTRYINWNKGGSRGVSPGSPKAEGKLGGSGAFTRMADTFAAAGAELYLDVNFTTAFDRPFLGLGRQVIKNVSNMPVEQFKYDLAIYQTTEEIQRRYYLYTPTSVTEAARKFSESKRIDGITGYSLGGQTVYTDAGTAMIDRATAEDYFTEAAAYLKQANGGLLASSPGAYVFPQLTAVTGTPVKSSRFTIEDETVPFYQMVTRGYIPTGLAPFNLSPDVRESVLKAAESGTFLTFAIVAETPPPVKESPLEWLYGASYDFWKQTFAEAVAELAVIYENVGGSEITRHEILQPGGVTRTTFENGAQVTVNFTETDVTVNGRVVNARGFACE